MTTAGRIAAEFIGTAFLLMAVVGSGIMGEGVITVCDHAREACPVYFGSAQRFHHSFPDPAAGDGSETERLAVFGRARDDLHLSCVVTWLDSLIRR